MGDTLDSIVRGTKSAARKTYRAVMDYRSTKKIELDRVLDPLLVAVGANLGYILSSDYALEQISKNVETHEGLAMMGGYAALASGLYAMNRHLMPKAIQKIRAHHQKKLRKRKQATSLSWLKTITTAGLLTATSMSQTTKEAFNNFGYDAQRITSAFSRGVKTPEPIESARKETEEPTTPLSKAPLKQGRKCFTGDLEDVKLGGLATQYTGIDGRAPKVVTVDFNERLNSLWKTKIRISGNGVVQETYDSKVRRYFEIPHTLMTIDDYLKKEIRPAIQDVKRNLDWGYVAESKRLNHEQSVLLRTIAESITEKDIMAYSLTELMPTVNGEVNIAIFDFLLRNAGKEYVELIPAIHDEYTSFGPYQFTSFALYDHKGEKRGASIINEALPPNKRVPGSVIKLEGIEHHKAAYLLAIDNIANMIRKLNRSQLGTLKTVWNSKRDDLVQFIATAHNKPGHAYESAQRWLDNGARSDYTNSCGNGIRVYSQKTGNNLDALMKQTG